MRVQESDKTCVLCDIKSRRQSEHQGPSDSEITHRDPAAASESLSLKLQPSEEFRLSRNDWEA